jgi:hypothetical protein
MSINGLRQAISLAPIFVLSLQTGVSCGKASPIAFPTCDRASLQVHPPRDGDAWQDEFDGTALGPAWIAANERDSPDRGTAAEEGIAIARDVVAAIKPRAQGIQLGAPGKDLTAILAVLDSVV